MQKIKLITLNALPIFLMIGLIPLVSNDYVLGGMYVLLITLALTLHRESNEISIFLFGLSIMIICEYLFVSTGVETFVRNSLFGLMPIWLPLLWGYSFVAMKRTVLLLSRTNH